LRLSIEDERDCREDDAKRDHRSRQKLNPRGSDVVLGLQPVLRKCEVTGVDHKLRHAIEDEHREHHEERDHDPEPCRGLDSI
jgi:hypothetical protein